MNELTRSIQEEVLWYIIFVYDKVLIDETNKVNARSLESKGFRLNMTKMEYLECKFNVALNEANM